VTIKLALGGFTLVTASAPYSSQELVRAAREGCPAQKLIVLLVEAAVSAVEFTGVADEVAEVTAGASTAEQLEVVEKTFRRARQLSEGGNEVILLIDSLTRLARIYNKVVPEPARSIVSGIDAQRIEPLQQLIHPTRDLTVLGIVRVETGSRMNEVIHELFKAIADQEIAWPISDR
jgi:transcription termination factor Rho